MRFLLFLSDMIVPMTFFLIVVFGIAKKVPLFDAFIDGAKDGGFIVLKIFPTLVGLMAAVAIIRASGLLEALALFLSPVAAAAGFPPEAAPLTLMRLVSSSASTGLLLDIYKTRGPDSFTGRFVSVMMSCTETVFYTLSVYFMSVKITKMRYTVLGALLANLAGVAAALFITRAAF